MSTLIKCKGTWFYRFQQLEKRRELSLRTTSKRQAAQKQQLLDELVTSGAEERLLQQVAKHGRILEQKGLTWRQLFAAFREQVINTRTGAGQQSRLRHYLVALQEFLGADNQVASFNPKRTPSDYIKRRKRAPKTLRDELSTLRRTLKWGYEEGLLLSRVTSKWATWGHFKLDHPSANLF